MRTRDKGYDDYGLTKERVAELKALCKTKDAQIMQLLHLAAYAANPSLAEDLVYSLAEGASYEHLWYIRNVYIPKADFYGHRRKTIYILDRLIGADN